MNIESLTPLAKAYLSAILAAQDAETPPDVEVSLHAEVTRTPVLSAAQIADLAIERGLAEILHLVTMPASRSQKIPLSWEQPTDAADLDVATGAGHALRAVRRHAAKMPRVRAVVDAVPLRGCGHGC